MSGGTSLFMGLLHLAIASCAILSVMWWSLPVEHSDKDLL